ncbi:hypothetical protein BZA05DRAFT_247133 [Tricharina praecox]|uniref:uncharacterized protein n=1 Tax=Tricharina praecox TaxID=43433 RepID=UPI00221FA230|nr:uncharacterized protein BZA05DRAFT_247133 [Tricharina praecox]KAI5854663.1 hypothetical protein BZA05DRAFT_247133 [Tricharina praecox]
MWTCFPSRFTFIYCFFTFCFLLSFLRALPACACFLLEHLRAFSTLAFVLRLAVIGLPYVQNLGSSPPNSV